MTNAYTPAQILADDLLRDDLWPEPTRDDVEPLLLDDGWADGLKQGDVVVAVLPRTEVKATVLDLDAEDRMIGVVTKFEDWTQLGRVLETVYWLPPECVRAFDAELDAALADVQAAWHDNAPAVASASR